MKDFFRRILPSHETIRNHRSLSAVSNLLHDPAIFHLTRRSASGGVATGLFIAMIPMPGHMLLAAIASIMLRVNLPLAIALVWVSNPVTLGPQLLMAFRIGARLTRQTIGPLHWEWSLHWVGSTLMKTWQEMVLGSMVMAILLSLLGYTVVNLLWRGAVYYRLWDRRRRRAASGEDQ